jgi:hypothetical protein
MKKLLVALLFCISRIAIAEPTAEDANQIFDTIQGMFTAIQKDDTKALYALQTADTQRMFEDADGFAKALKECCFVLHDAVQAKILGADVKSDTEVNVAVLIVDKRNYVWGAVFILQKEEGVWKVDQCHIKLVQDTTSKKPEMSI